MRNFVDTSGRDPARGLELTLAAVDKLLGQGREARVRAEAVEEARQRIALLSNSKTKPEDTKATAKQRITLLSKTKTEDTKATAEQEQELYPLTPGGYRRQGSVVPAFHYQPPHCLEPDQDQEINRQIRVQVKWRRG